MICYYQRTLLNQPQQISTLTHCANPANDVMHQHQHEHYYRSSTHYHRLHDSTGTVRR